MSLINERQRADARAHIERLHRQRQIPEEDLEELERGQSDSRVARIREYIEFNDKQLRSLVTVVSEEIYTSAGGVVFELIQNADDASYSHSSVPCITFILHHDKIIIEGNEDGFESKDVKAICEVGNSRKGEDSIGEKGLGFKSVFMIASKVHIESAGYSFSFSYKKGEREAQKYTPKYEQSDYPDDGLTRITLFLVGDEIKRRETLQKFKEVPATLLLFLRKVKKLTIINNLEDGGPGSTTYTCQQESTQREVITRDITRPDGSISTDAKHFHIIIQPTIGVWTNEKRKEKNPKIKLAFPLSPSNCPLIENQPDIFAYLPIGNAGVGFYFLIQSDFATTANREALVTTSPRNIALRDGIAEAFRKAVLEFSEDPSLQFSWMSYLPDNSVSDKFWTVLRSTIEELLCETPFLRSHSGRLDVIRNLRIVPKEYRDEENNPIFSDLPLCEKYVNRGYIDQIEKLKTLGLEELSVTDLIERVERDVNPANSRMKLATTDDEWHTLAANSLRSLLPQDRLPIMALELIPIIPLGKTEWVSAAAGNVYLPYVDNISVPTDLGIKLVHPEALKNLSRELLFSDLCVEVAPSKLIRQAIFEKYRSSHDEFGWKASYAHLRYLWWTHPGPNEDDAKLMSHVYVYNQNQEPIYPKAKEKNIFFDSDDQYGVRNLFSGDKSLLLHEDYLRVPSPEEKKGHPSWEDWLSDFIGVQKYPPLIARDNSSQLSSIFQAVVKYRPEMVVGLLEAHWGEYHMFVSDNEDIKNKIANIEVPCEIKNGEKFKGCLNILDLPVPALRKICEPFSVEFPFLKLPARITDSDHSKWDFLLLFGVNSKPNYIFYLRVLHFYWEDQQNPDLERVFDLYDRIYFHCIQDGCRKDQQKTTLSWISGKKLIFHPTSDIGTLVWTGPESCLWDAPSYMESKVPLMARYLSIPNISVPARFFQEILEIKNVTYEDLIQELEFLQNSKDGVCFENIKDIYFRLNSMRLENPDICSEILGRFEKSNLIFIHSQIDDSIKSWKAPSSCLWSSRADITGRYVVSKQFDQYQHKNDLKAFFVDCLNVSEPSLEMLVGELKALAAPLVGRSFPIEDADSIKMIKILITAINSMHLNQAVSMGKKLRSESIFPVRLKNMKMLKSTADYFWITDRQKYQEAFKNEVLILGFSLEEVLRLKPFLEWLGVEERYLSCRVTEHSTFDGSEEACSHDLTQDLIFRAKSLVRCAVHFRSLTTQGKNSSLLQLLSEVTVYQSDDISSSLELSQIADGKPKLVSCCSSKSKLHIDRENNGKLRIYVPRDERQRLLCYHKLLPEKIVSDIFKQLPGSFLSLTGPNVVRVLATILNVPQDQEMLDELLEDFGIGQLPERLEKDIQVQSGDEPKLEVNSLGSGGDSDGERASRFSDDSPTSTSSSSISRSSAVSRLSTPSTEAAQSNSNSSISSAALSQSSSPTSMSRAQLRQNVSSTHAQPVSSAVINENPSSLLDIDDQEQYKRLLDRIINAAKEVDIPTHGAFNMNALQREIISILDSSDNDSVSDISYTGAFGDRSVNQLKHDMKIGVAGELFVYELLSNLRHGASQQGLPDFGPVNWCSSIRDYVRVHPGCEERLQPVENPSKREEADIIYKDKNHVLTQFLLDKLYLKPSDRWRDAEPTYYIEVKTTLKECSTKFYMSRSQHRRMRDITSSQSSPVEKVYLIFRVYRLNEKDIGLRIYADPDELEFHEENFSVTPATRA